MSQSWIHISRFSETTRKVYVNRKFEKVKRRNTILEEEIKVTNHKDPLCKLMHNCETEERRGQERTGEDRRQGREEGNKVRKERNK